MLNWFSLGKLYYETKFQSLEKVVNDIYVCLGTTDLHTCIPIYLPTHAFTYVPR